MTLFRLTSILILALGSLSIQAQSSFPSDINTDSLARLPYVKRADLDADGQMIYDMLPGQRPSGDVSGPLAWPAYNPGVAKALLDLHNAAVAADTLNAYERELAIMVACRETNYQLEWNAHEGAALRAGIPASVLEIVRTNQSVNGISEKDATIIHLGRQLYRDKKVDSATFAKAAGFFGNKGVMDMVAVMNTYAVSGFFAITVDEHLPAGEEKL
jgi:4-carboxymuconolactone decarboxylase